jgi:hypothetical protein
LNRSQNVAKHLQNFILAIVAADDLATQIEEFEQLAGLIHISGGQDQFDPVLFQFLDNRNEERNVRGIVEINPDLFGRLFCISAE